MSLVTGSYTSRGERAQREFDTLLGVDSIEWPLAREDRSATAPSAIELLLESEPAVPRASLLTVVGLFITLAIAQVVIMSLVVANFDLAGIRLALIYVFGAPDRKSVV